MNKTFPLVLKVFVIVTLLLTNVGVYQSEKVSAGEYDNLLANPGFENGSAGWVDEDTALGRFSIDDTIAHSGTHALKYTSQENATVTDKSFLVNNTPCTPSTSYIFSVWYKAVKQEGCTHDLPGITGSEFACMEIRDNNTSATIAGNNGKGLIFDGMWHKYITIIKTGTAANLFSAVRIRTWSKHAVNYYFDDFEVRKANPEEVLNWGFESGESNWANASTNGAYSVTTSEKHSGDASLMLKGTGAPATAWFTNSPAQSIQLSSDKFYLFSFWYKLDNRSVLLTNGAGNSFYVTLRTSATTYVQANGDGLIDDNKWHRYVKGFKATTTAPLTYFSVRNYNNVIGNNFYFDDFALSELSNSDQIKTFMEASTNNLFVNPAYDIELGNGNFEQGNISPWYCESSGAVFDSTQHHGGVSSMKLLGNKTDSAFYRNISLAPNTYYKLTFWYKTDTTDPTNVSAYFSSADTVWGGNSPHFINRISLPPSNEWTQFIRTFKNESSHFGVIRFRKESIDTNNTYFDDISLEKIEPFGITITPNMNTLTADGSLIANIKVSNAPGITKKVFAAAVLYCDDGNRLEDINTDVYTYTATDNEDIHLNLTLPDSLEGKFVKIFAWDADSIEPLKTCVLILPAP